MHFRMRTEAKAYIDCNTLADRPSNAKQIRLVRGGKPNVLQRCPPPHGLNAVPPE